MLLAPIAINKIGKGKTLLLINPLNIIFIGTVYPIVKYSDRISAASFIRKLNKDEDKEVEIINLSVIHINIRNIRFQLRFAQSKPPVHV